MERHMWTGEDIPSRHLGLYFLKAMSHWFVVFRLAVPSWRGWTSFIQGVQTEINNLPSEAPSFSASQFTRRKGILWKRSLFNISPDFNP